MAEEVQGTVGGESGSTAVATMTPSLQARMLDLRVRERRIVVRSTDRHAIVTAIEILSPSNKLHGSAGRVSYLSKRDELLQSDAHFIEIDLLRAGKRTEPVYGMGRGDYLTWLSRSQHRTHVDYWPTPLETSLPTIPVPLLAGDPDVPLNLQALFHDAYDRCGYVRRLDYSQPVPAPPLSDAQINWLAGIAQMQSDRILCINTLNTKPRLTTTRTLFQDRTAAPDWTLP